MNGELFDTWIQIITDLFAAKASKPVTIVWSMKLMSFATLPLSHMHITTLYIYAD